MPSPYFSWLEKKKKKQKTVTSVFPGVPSFRVVCAIVPGGAQCQGLWGVRGLVFLLCLHNLSLRQSCPYPTCMAPSVQPLCCWPRGTPPPLALPPSISAEVLLATLKSSSQEAGLTIPSLCHLHLRLLLAKQKIFLIWGNCFFPPLFFQNNLSFFFFLIFLC